MSFGGISASFNTVLKVEPPSTVILIVPFEVPELGIKEEKGGTMWGVDIFMRRK